MITSEKLFELVEIAHKDGVNTYSCAVCKKDFYLFNPDGSVMSNDEGDKEIICNDCQALGFRWDTPPASSS